MIDVAYAAGLFDGEGHAFAGIKTNQKSERQRFNTYQIKTIVTNCDRRPLEALQERWGGSLYCYQRGTSKHRPATRWYLCSLRAVKFLEDILPFLIIKRDVVVALLELQSTVNHTGGRAVRITPEVDLKRSELYKVIRSLNKRGPRVEEVSI